MSRFTMTDIEAAKTELPGIIEMLGIAEVFEACMTRCLEGRKSNDPQEASLFAHRIFLMSMQDWLKEKV